MSQQKNQPSKVGFPICLWDVGYQLEKIRRKNIKKKSEQAKK